MGRHDISLGQDAGAALASGLHAGTPVLTSLGWRRLADLRPGDLIPTRGSGVAAVRALRPARQAPWSVLIPAGALNNTADLLVPPGQPILIETRRALPFSGEPHALVPATALEGWHGVEPHVPPRPAPILHLCLTRPGTVYAGPGLLAAAAAEETPAFADSRLAVLSLASARRLIASLIAEEASAACRTSLPHLYRP